MAFYNNIIAGAAGAGGAADYQISKSLRFNPSDTSYLSRTPTSAGNRKTFTFSCWLKKSGINSSNRYQLLSSYASGSVYFTLEFETEKLKVFDGSAISGGLATDTVFRDPSAWYHILCAVDTTDGTAANRVKLYVNGVQQTLTGTQPSQNSDLSISTTTSMSVGALNTGSILHILDGYLADVHFIDGQALAPTEFGEYDNNNLWQPKEFTGTHNTARSIPSYPAVTISPSVIGGGNVSHVNGGGTYFYSQASTGAGSIKVEFSSPITGVTSIKMNGGGYGVGSTYHIKINGSDVLTNLTTASGWAQVEHTISSTDISSFEIYTTNAGWSLYNLLFNDTSPSGTASLVIPAGVNGFHLDFSDNSSNAALGINAASADDYTSTVGALTTSQAVNFYSVSSNPAKNLFDGSTSTIVYGGYNSSSNNSDLVWTPNGSYSVSSSLRVYVGYYSTIYVNGVSKATGGQSSGQAWVTLSHTGSITSIKFENTSNANIVRAAAIEVDGTIVETTAWTVNNLSAAGSAWDQSQTWSSLGTGTAYNSNYVWANAFDGDKTVNSPTTFPAGSNTMTWTPSSAITVNTSVIVYVYNQTDGSSYGIKVNGSYLPGTNNYAVAVTRTAAQLSNQLTSIELVTSSGNLGPYLAAVEVDGVLLVDSGVVDTAASNIDSLIDTPTNITADSGNNPGNYCLLNPLQNGGLTLSNGNLDVAKSAGGWATTTGTIGISSGKYYFEYTATTAYDNHMIGVVTSDVTLSTYLGNYASGWGYQSNGNKVHADSFTGSQPTANSGGDIIQVAVDMDAGKIWFGINGTYIGSGNPSSGANPAYSNLSGTVFPAVSHAGTLNGSFNFGARDFSYTPPTNFVSICTTNLPDPTIADGSTAMDVKLWTGDDATSRAITGLNFSPSLLWIKSRSSSGWHVLADALRGAGKILASNSANSEYDDTDSQNAIQSFDSNGFTIGDQGSWLVNDNNITTVGWAWDAGSSNTSIGVGGLNSSVYNQSQVWSTAGTITNDLTSSSQGIDKAFDGSLDNNNQHYWFAQDGTTSRYTFPSIQTGTKFELYMAVSITNTNFSVNGQTSSNVPASGLSHQWVDVTDAVTASGLGGLSYIEISYSASNYAQYVFAIRIDNVMYIDNGVTPPTTVPTIASTVRANPTTGVSIINYVGTGNAGNVAHGLNTAPEFFIIKNRELSNYDWWTWHKGIGPNYYVRLNSSNASAYAGHFFAEAPDSNVIKFEGGVGVTSTTRNHIVYAFAPVSGFSAFGKFSGNSNTDGPFQYCGFKPRFLLLKGITQARDWIILDTERDSGNVGDSYLHPNTNGAESTYAIADILSNGFKMRYSGGLANQTGEDYIWAAFCEHPFKTARAR